MTSSKRIETQIKGIQDKAEGVKTQVRDILETNIVKTQLNFLDHPDTVVGAAVTATSSKSIKQFIITSSITRYPC